MIWFCRNGLAHGKEGMLVESAAMITKDRVNKYWSPNFKFHILDEEGGLSWEAPKGSAIKINCDGSWFSDSKRVGFGFIAWDSAGYVVGSELISKMVSHRVLRQKYLPFILLCVGQFRRTKTHVFLRQKVVPFSVFSIDARAAHCSNITGSKNVVWSWSRIIIGECLWSEEKLTYWRIFWQRMRH